MGESPWEKSMRKAQRKALRKAQRSPGGEPGEDTEEFLELQEKLKNPEKMTRLVSICPTTHSIEVTCDQFFFSLPCWRKSQMLFFMSRFERAKYGIQQLVEKVGFFGILAAARFLTLSPWNVSLLFPPAFQTPCSTWQASHVATSLFHSGHSSAPPSLGRLWSRCTSRLVMINKNRRGPGLIFFFFQKVFVILAFNKELFEGAVSLLVQIPVLGKTTFETLLFNDYEEESLKKGLKLKHFRIPAWRSCAAAARSTEGEVAQQRGKPSGRNTNAKDICKSNGKYRNKLCNKAKEANWCFCFTGWLGNQQRLRNICSLHGKNFWHVRFGLRAVALSRLPLISTFVVQVTYFVVSIINSLAQSYKKRLEKEKRID